jgi:integrase
MPKQQEGQLFMKEGLGWYGRYYATVEGERVRVCRSLKTHNKAVARRKLARLIAEGNVAPEEAQRPETFEEAARRVVEAQQRAGMVTWKDRLHRLEQHALPTIGKLLPGAIRATHVRGILEEARDGGAARETLKHIRGDISTVLDELWRGEELPEIVVDRVEVPEALPSAVAEAKKERAVLEDDELVRYLAWEHPQPRFRGAVLERQVMSCVSRMFGGLRTSDLHSVKWEGFTLPDFEQGLAPRKKGARLSHGGKPQPLVVPAPLRAILNDWWQRQGRPMTGYVFPVRRGDTAGKAQRKKGMSHAKALRRDLQRAFGLEVFKQTGVDRKGNPVGDWVPAREMTQREVVLFSESEWSKPLDFHSWRRSYNQALADAGVNAQQAQALAGHSSLDAHERYLRNTEKARTIPAEALPALGVAVIGQPRLGTEQQTAAETQPATDEADDEISRIDAVPQAAGELRSRRSQVRILWGAPIYCRIRDRGRGRAICCYSCCY